MFHYLKTNSVSDAFDCRLEVWRAILQRKNRQTSLPDLGSLIEVKDEDQPGLDEVVKKEPKETKNSY